MNSILQTLSLSKYYGSLKAVESLNLTVDKGQVFGLLGPNGSGKTTTLGMLLGVIQSSSGSFTWFGKLPSATSRQKIGAILEAPSFYPYLSAIENLKIVAKIKNSEKERIEIVLNEVGLMDRRKDRYSNYSLGMKQRLAIASALLSDPEVLILDEPTNGLDPQGIVEIREIIHRIAEKGKTIILASHLLGEVQKVCSHFAVLNKGKKLFQGSVSEATSGQATIEVGASDMSSLKEILDSLSGIKGISKEGDYYRLMIEQEVTIEYISGALLEKGITPTHLRRTESSLEEQFIKILENK
ncbi:MAG: ATP-binding cassette domain-containing protein [Reichenbachiella sp.]